MSRFLSIFRPYLSFLSSFFLRFSPFRDRDENEIKSSRVSLSIHFSIRKTFSRALETVLLLLLYIPRLFQYWLRKATQHRMGWRLFINFLSLSYRREQQMIDSQSPPVFSLMTSGIHPLAIPRKQFSFFKAYLYFFTSVALGRLSRIVFLWPTRDR